MTAARALLVFAALARLAFAAQYSLELTPEKTRIEWSLSDVLHTVHGTFNLKSGAIDFDTDTGAASGRIIVDLTSGASGNGTRDRRMHASVLESAKYPEAFFTPDRFEGKIDVPGASSVKLHGMFTIHGAPHELTMDVGQKSEENQMSATADFSIPYVAWGMKDPSTFLLRVNKAVEVSIHATGKLARR